MPPPSLTRKILTSVWEGLNENLIAKFYEVDRKMNPTGNVEVWAPLLEANLEMSFGWNSPFENTGPESKVPAILQMAQAGVFSQLIESIAPYGSGAVNKILKKAADSVKGIEGRSGITKLNSTQVFTGMAPVKFPVTALFRAWRDPQVEVEMPADQLMTWALPVKMADDVTLSARAMKAAQGREGAIDVLMPTQVPTMVAMFYKGYTYGPLVIETIGRPLSSPIDYLGRYASLQVPMTLCSLTAIDRDDWKGWRNYFSPDP